MKHYLRYNGFQEFRLIKYSHITITYKELSTNLLWYGSLLFTTINIKPILDYFILQAYLDNVSNLIQNKQKKN